MVEMHEITLVISVRMAIEYESLRLLGDEYMLVFIHCLFILDLIHPLICWLVYMYRCKKVILKCQVLLQFGFLWWFFFVKN